MKKTRKITSIVLSILMLISAVSTINLSAYAATTSTISVTGTYKQSDARSMLSSINSFRTGNQAWYWNQDNKTKTTCKNLGKLKYSYELEKAAMQRAAEIAVKFSHTRPDGTSYKTAYSINNSCSGENIAMGYKTAADAFKAWQEANEKYAGQGHRRNMLYSKYNTVGIAHIVVDGIDYWVQEFSADKTVGKSTVANNKSTTVKVKVQSNFKLQAPLRKSSSTNSSKITVNWYSVSGASGYQADCSSDKNFNNKKTVSTNSKTLTASFSSLKANTKYYVRIRAYRTVNGQKVYGNWSSVYNYTTSKASTTQSASTASKNNTTNTATIDTKLAVPNVNVTMQNSKSITFYWQEISGISGYQAQLSTNSSFTNPKQVNVTGNDRKAVFNGLNSETAYYVRVRSYKTSSGKTTYSSWSKVKTIVTQ